MKNNYRHDLIIKHLLITFTIIIGAILVIQMRLLTEEEREAARLQGRADICAQIQKGVQADGEFELIMDINGVFYTYKIEEVE